MVRGIAYSNVCQSFFSPSARTQFLFSLPPFARPFTALLLIECLRVAVFASLYDSRGAPFHFICVDPSPLICCA